MNKKYTLGIIPLLLLAFLAQMTSCSPEHFVDATQLAIINYDTIPLTIYVDGEEATSFDSFWGEVHLNSGSYEIVAKSRGEEIDKASFSRQVDQGEEGARGRGGERVRAALCARGLALSGDIGDTSRLHACQGSRLPPPRVDRPRGRRRADPFRRCLSFR